MIGGKVNCRKKFSLVGKQKEDANILQMLLVSSHMTPKLEAAENSWKLRHMEDDQM